MRHSTAFPQMSIVALEFAKWSAWDAISFLRFESVKSVFSPSANAVASDGATRTPVFMFSIISGIPPTVVPRNGVSANIA